MKGIILAGGHGTRLYPLTNVVSKQLLPLYDKPIIYYPLSMLMLAGIREILLISTPGQLPGFQKLLGDGSEWGLKLAYQVQVEPVGLPDAFLVGREFIADDPVCLILGDNIFFGHGLPATLRTAIKELDGATILAYSVKDPQRYGVVELGEKGQALSIEEKPHKPRSNWAITGLYFFDSRVVEFSAGLRPSSRGELEITDLIRRYLEIDKLKVELLGRGVAWLDAGTPETLLQAANFIQAVEERQGMMISCPEEIAWRMGFIDDRQLQHLAASFNSNRYGQYLGKLI
jgi:glucose-1-phosphate thymidylyltransferase